MTVAHKTAIARKNPSAPMKRLAADGRLVGRTLDFGCGRGYDASHFCMESYDPHYQPVMPEGRFDTITCNYVLNVIESAEEREAVVMALRSMLAQYGTAYITVRNDKRALNGTTRTGTWQGLVTLNLPVVHKCAGYITYELRSNYVG